MSVQHFNIGCFLTGTDPLSNTFEVEIEDLASTSLYGLKKKIELEIKTGLPPSQLLIYKVHVEVENVSRVLDYPRAPLLAARLSLSDYWTHEELLTGYIHVVVELPTSDPQKAPVQPALVQPEDDIHKIAKLLEDTQLAVIAKQREHSSSEWAQPTQFRKLQNTEGRILNGRPGDEVGLPIGFYHPVFGGFLTNLALQDPLPSTLRILTRDLFVVSQQVFDGEDKREGTITELLGSLVGESFSKMSAEDVDPDGMITSWGGACCVLLEIKNEIGSGGCDPSIQAAISYSKYWGSIGMDKVRVQSCCPSLLVSIAGPWMCILGAVFIDRPVVQPLTDFIWLGDNPQRPSCLDYVARIFHCVSLARQELQTFYRDLSLAHTGKQLERFFPYIVSYPDSLARQVHFSYTSKLGAEDSSKAIFRATTLKTEKPKDIVVKFVQSYNAEAHRLLADHKLAPQLLYDGSETPNLGPGFSMVVMEFVAGVDLLHYIDGRLPERARDDIKRALQLLHEGGFVFGDLRAPNVMVTKDTNGNVTGGMLVDFDWCGKIGKGIYPTLMNREINWADGMKPDQPMEKDHDDVMFERLWFGIEMA